MKPFDLVSLPAVLALAVVSISDSSFAQQTSQVPGALIWIAAIGPGLPRCLLSLTRSNDALGLKTTAIYLSS